VKIIAKTTTGDYLVEMTGNEIAQSAGFPSTSHLPKIIRSHDEYSLKLGTRVDVERTQSYLQRLRQHEDGVRHSAAALRALAQMLEAALPTTIIPPADATD
jgi:hypothetical protein